MKNCYERRLLLLGPWSIASFAPAPFLWQLPVYGSRPPHLPSRPGAVPLAVPGLRIAPSASPVSPRRPPSGSYRSTNHAPASPVSPRRLSFGSCRSTNHAPASPVSPRRRSSGSPRSTDRGPRIFQARTHYLYNSVLPIYAIVQLIVCDVSLKTTIWGMWCLDNSMPS